MIRKKLNMCGIFAAINKKSNTFDLSKCLVALSP